MNFNDIFKKQIDWDRFNLTDNAPCKTCKYNIDLRKKHPGNNWDQPKECNNCLDKLNWTINCLNKLYYLEHKKGD